MPLRNSELEGWTHGAFVHITTLKAFDTFVRPAAFVWASEDGIEWVEPSYADPWGAASPSYHERRGTWEGNLLNTGDTVIDILPFDPEVDQEYRSARALIWFNDYLQKAGITWEAERARVRAELDQPTS